MTAPHIASDNTAIEAAQARQLANAERYLRDMLAAFLANDPVATHRDNLVAAIDAHQQLRIRDGFQALRDAAAVRTIR